jgi:prevent-host-death family protein
VQVGIKELRQDAGSWVDRASNGDEVLITRRGRVVAKLVPMDGALRKLDQMIVQGIARAPKKPKDRVLPPLIEGAGSVSDLVAEIRDR